MLGTWAICAGLLASYEYWNVWKSSRVHNREGAPTRLTIQSSIDEPFFQMMDVHHLSPSLWIVLLPENVRIGECDFVVQFTRTHVIIRGEINAGACTIQQTTLVFSILRCSAAKATILDSIVRPEGRDAMLTQDPAFCWLLAANTRVDERER